MNSRLVQSFIELQNGASTIIFANIDHFGLLRSIQIRQVILMCFLECRARVISLLLDSAHLLGALDVRGDGFLDRTNGLLGLLLSAAHSRLQKTQARLALVVRKLRVGEHC